MQGCRSLFVRAHRAARFHWKEMPDAEEKKNAVVVYELARVQIEVSASTFANWPLWPRVNHVSSQ